MGGARARRSRSQARKGGLRPLRYLRAAAALALLGILAACGNSKAIPAPSATTSGTAAPTATAAADAAPITYAVDQIAIPVEMTPTTWNVAKDYPKVVTAQDLPSDAYRKGFQQGIDVLYDDPLALSGLGLRNGWVELYNRVLRYDSASSARAVMAMLRDADRQREQAGQIRFVNLGQVGDESYQYQVASKGTVAKQQVDFLQVIVVMRVNNILAIVGEYGALAAVQPVLPEPLVWAKIVQARALGQQPPTAPGQISPAATPTPTPPGPRATATP